MTGTGEGGILELVLGMGIIVLEMMTDVFFFFFFLVFWGGGGGGWVKNVFVCKNDWKKTGEKWITAHHFLIF